jgi:DNA-binding MarR family transcriptional regulator
MTTSLNLPVFQILLALWDRPLHGLGIAEHVEVATEGEVQLGPGTLYRSLKEMAGAGLIREVDKPDADPRRRYYELTARGRRVGPGGGGAARADRRRRALAQAPAPARVSAP